MAYAPVKLEAYVIKELAAARRRLGYSYEEMERRTGLHRTSISLIERGKRHPTLISCLKLAQALNVDLARLLTSA